MYFWHTLIDRIKQIILSLGGLEDKLENSDFIDNDIRPVYKAKILI